MARPRKNNAEWFSHDTTLRDNLKVKAVRAKFWLEWYAVFLMLLEVLTDAENFAIEGSAFHIEMLAGDFRIDSERLSLILEYCQNIWLLQKEWDMIFNNHLIERMDPLLNKRENMRQKHQEKRVSTAKTPVSASDTPKPAAPPKPVKPKPETMSDEDFEQFWIQYPVKEDKKKAKEKFMKLHRSLFQVIMDSVKLNKEKNMKWKEWFAKMPTTWINGECWNDELPTLTPNRTANAKANTGWNASKQWRVSTQWSADLVV